MDPKVKELIEKLTKHKLDIVEALAEKDEIFEPNVLLRMVWELRSIVKTLKWLKE